MQYDLHRFDRKAARAAKRNPKEDLMLRLLWIAVLACTASFHPFALAQTFPDRPVKIIAVFPPGGGSDVLVRLLAPKLQELWGQPVVVENRAGAQGAVGTNFALKSKPDGYTILAIVTGPIALSPHMQTGIGYDVLKDLVPVVRATQQPVVMVGNPNVPVKSLKDVEELARAKPGKLTFGSSSAQPQLVGEYFKVSRKVDLLHVRYNGVSPALVDVLSGTTDLLIGGPAAVSEHIKAGKLRGIVVFGRERVDSMPDVPSALEAGYPELSDLVEWYGYGVPAGTPQPIVDKLSADFLKVLNDPEIKEAVRGRGLRVSPASADEFSRQLRTDYERWGNLIKATGVRGD